MIWKSKIGKFVEAEDLQEVRKEAQIEVLISTLNSLCKSELNANGRNYINNRIIDLTKEIENLKIWTSTN